VLTLLPGESQSIVMAGNRCDVVFRVILLGYNSVGKTTMMKKYAGEDTPDVMSTIGVTWSSKVVTWKGVKVKLQLWTTAKQERYSTLSAQSCSKADAVVFVFDVTDMSTFSGIGVWLETLGVSSAAEMVLVGNKVDMKDRRVVTAEMGRAKAKSFSSHGVPYFETCALNEASVERVFSHLVKCLIQKKVPNRFSLQSSQVISLEVQPASEEATKRCCSGF